MLGVTVALVVAIISVSAGTAAGAESLLGSGSTGESAIASASISPSGVPFQVTYDGKSFAASLPPSSIATYTWTPGSGTVGVTETATSGGSLAKSVELAREPSLSFGATRGSMPTVRVNPSVVMQKIAGFGGAMTQSSASLINNSPSEKKIMDALFGPAGAHFNLIRVPMGASDFVTGPIYQDRTSFSYDDNGGKADPTLAHFSIGTRSAKGAKAKVCAPAPSSGEYGTGDYSDTIPALLCAKSLNPSVSLLAVPWSAPGWMKIDDPTVPARCAKADDFLKDSDYATYARYFLKFLEAYQSARLPVAEISMQNEPENCSTTYPTMEMKPSDQATFAKDLRSAVRDARGRLSVTPTIMAYDHDYLNNPNSPWDAPANQVTGYPEAVISQSGGTSTSVGPVGLVGFHHYNGTLAQEEQALDSEHRAYPIVPIWMTEATGTHGASTQAQNFVWEGRHDLMEPLQNWASASLYLNLALNSRGAPHHGGCGDGSNPCRGMVTLDADGAYSLNEDYYDWAQFSKFIQPGATHICSDILDLSTRAVDPCAAASTSWIPTNGDNLIDTVAFRNPNKSITLVAMNTTPDANAATGWNKAIPLPGITARIGFANEGPEIESVSCSSTGNCAAGGVYVDKNGANQAFVADEVNGTWHDAIEVPGTAALNDTAYGTVGAEVTTVSCASAGNCAAGGYYTDSSTALHAFIADEVNGTWQDATQVPGTAALNTGGWAQVDSVSCASAGNCAAGGSYSDGSAQQVFVDDEVNGSWRDATQVPGIAALNTGPSAQAQFNSVSCASTGNCAADGYYVDADNVTQAFIADEVNGTWQRAVEVPGIAALNAAGAEATSVSCASAGNCTAGGWYSNSAKADQAFIADEVNGTWQRAVEVPGIGALSDVVASQIASISCASTGNCTAGGYYVNASEVAEAFVADEVNGTWQDAIQVPGIAALNVGGPSQGPDAQVKSVSCGLAGNCAIGGFYVNSSGEYEAFVAQERNGGWQDAIEVPGTAPNDGGSMLTTMSCARAGDCTAGGSYSSSAGSVVFVASS